MSRDVLAAAPRVRRLAWQGMSLLARILPLSATRLLGLLVARMWWCCDAPGRRAVTRNLAPFLPAACPEARLRTARRMFASCALNLAELLRLERLFTGPGAETVTLCDPWRVFAGRPLAGPVILATAHANWEQLGAVLHRLGLAAQVEGPALRCGDEWIDTAIDRRRARVGMRAIGLDHAPLAALRALRAGRVLLLVADRDYAGSGLPMPVGSARLRTPIGPAALAVQTGAPIVPLLLLRRGLGRWQLVVGRPLRAETGEAKAQAVPRLTRDLARALARLAAASPGQWIAFHRVWL